MLCGGCRGRSGGSAVTTRRRERERAREGGAGGGRGAAAIRGRAGGGCGARESARAAGLRRLGWREPRLLRSVRLRGCGGHGRRTLSGGVQGKHCAWVCVGRGGVRVRAPRKEGRVGLAREAGRDPLQHREGGGRCRGAAWGDATPVPAGLCAGKASPGVSLGPGPAAACRRRAGGGSPSEHWRHTADQSVRPVCARGWTLAGSAALRAGTHAEPRHARGRAPPPRAPLQLAASGLGRREALWRRATCGACSVTAASHARRLWPRGHGRGRPVRALVARVRVHEGGGDAWTGHTRARAEGVRREQSMAAALTAVSAPGDWACACMGLRAGLPPPRHGPAPVPTGTDCWPDLHLWSSHTHRRPGWWPANAPGPSAWVPAGSLGGHHWPPQRPARQQRLLACVASARLRLGSGRPLLMEPPRAWRRHAGRSWPQVCKPLRGRRTPRQARGAPTANPQLQRGRREAGLPCKRVASECQETACQVLQAPQEHKPSCFSSLTSCKAPPPQLPSRVAACQVGAHRGQAHV